MTALTGKQINNSYKDLLQVSNSNSGIDVTLRDMSDGEGTVGPVKISTTTMQWPAGKILDIDGTFDFGGAATVSGTWAIANGGTGATTALAATQNLGVEVGVDIQAYSAALDSISGLTTAADKMIYTTAADTYAVADLTEAARNLLDDADAAAQRVTLNAMENVLTTRGDLLVRGATAEERFAIGADGQVLGSDGTDPVWTTPFAPRGYIDGFVCSRHAGDTDHDLQITAGTCRNEANTATFSLTSSIVKRIDASWAEGTNQGGLFSGTVAAVDSYHVCVIAKDTDGTIDVGFDTSPVGANKPAGWTFIRRVWSVRTDASANIFPFYQIGDVCRYPIPQLNVSTASISTTATTVGITVPTGIVVDAQIRSRGRHTATVYTLITALDDVDQLPSVDLFDDSFGDSYIDSAEIYRKTNTSAQIRYRHSATVSIINWALWTMGYVDRRGRDA